MNTQMLAHMRQILAGRRVLVTGHTGFKGAWLSLWLRELGAEVHGLALAPPSAPSAFEAMALGLLLASETRQDVRDGEALRATLARTEPEVVFHLAAQPLVRQSSLVPPETFAINVMGTVHLLEALRRRARPCTVVVVTSDKCYAERAAPHSHAETDPLGGHDAYAASKAAAEIVTASYRASFFPPAQVADHGIAIATARAGNVIGGGDWGRDRLVPDTIRSLAAGEVVAIRAPEAVRPWQHVLEPLGGYLALAARLHDRRDPARGRFATAYNFGPSSEAERPVRHVVSALVSAWGKGHWQAVREIDGPREAPVLRLSVAKASHELGWSSRWPFAQTVDETVRWYRAHHEGAAAQTLRALSISQIEAFCGEGAQRPTA